MSREEDESRLLEAMNKIRTPAYWNNFKIRQIKRTRQILEKIFDLSLTMSDKMFINKYVSELVQEWAQTPVSVNSWKQGPYHVGPEMACKFLMIHYNVRDIDAMQDVIYRGKGRLAFNKMLKESSIPN